MKKLHLISYLILPALLVSCSINNYKKNRAVLSNSKPIQIENPRCTDKPRVTQSSAASPDTSFYLTYGSKVQEGNPPIYEMKAKEIVLPKVNISQLKTDEKSWYFIPKADGTPSGAPTEAINWLNNFSAYYLGDTSKKVLYLTFDEGYENGYTTSILDTLKRNNVKAAFFVVKPYILSNKDLVKRMVIEGHLVGNHSVNHPSMPTIKDISEFNSELSGVEEAFKETTGKDMVKFFRPPMGKYSELSLYNTAAYGYHSIFWSFAYDDWDTRKQPDPEHAKRYILARTHNGAIILLHAVSKTNVDILDYLIKEWKKEGYEFKSLVDLP